MSGMVPTRGGSRPEDAQFRRLLDQNRSTITKLADQISGGAYSASKVPRQAPVAEGLMIHVGGGRPAPAEPRLSVRVSVNRRVVAVDDNTGRQLHHIGEVRRRDGTDVFVLATKANGFFSPVDEGVAEALAALDGVRLGTTLTESQLAADIGERLASL